MKNLDILRKISQGMYVLTTQNGGCIVDAVSQVSAGDNPLIAVSVMNKNYTNELMKVNDKFALSILDEKVNGEIIKTFGFNSARDINKFEKVKTEEVEGVNIISDSIGYMVCEIIDRIQNDTHTLFIGKLIEADMFKESKEMTYAYYQEHKEDILKVTTENGKTAWVCMACGYVYYGDELPEDFVCPVCGLGKEMFKKKE
ncbi:MAG: flavin reductase [Clostridia bacterium]|nr:flavin reductase [Clostridia bacterium]